MNDANNAINKLLEMNANEEAKRAKDKLDSLNKLEQEKQQKELQNTKQELIRNATQAIDGLVALQSQNMVNDKQKQPSVSTSLNLTQNTLVTNSAT